MHVSDFTRLRWYHLNNLGASERFFYHQEVLIFVKSLEVVHFNSRIAKRPEKEQYKARRCQKKR